MWAFDGIEEATAAPHETNRRCFLVLIEHRSSVIYKKCVLDLSLRTMVAKDERLSNQASFNGCTGSNGAVRAGMLSCVEWTHVLHKGLKMRALSRTCNATVSRARQTLGSTRGKT